MTVGETLLAQITPLMEGLRGRLMADSPMSKITWFQVGGPADVLFQPVDEDDLALFFEEFTC